ncbi:lysophospholipid acyltransferase family protein [Arcticibacterium luteifluviistationis]|uniref:Lipid A biosynthesis acyltransferase n=1 Tax=Arcticibacterium luteifluviistationis TaxID=1784714 RepID=A0A2Z4G756_9BACT|nr:lysophospholipid acyltransferase family protein [Arcticibacterium luteifluviistationis]AWV96975.1 lipid A biosynthesis acyltransferase [Arcticibacterium luteifluviistationis]
MLKINLKAVLYYCTLPFIFLVSVLPFWLLYLISDLILYPALYLLVGYRKKIVRANLLNAFPEKDLEEIIEIEKRFYHYLCDLFLETFKSITISEKELKKRLVYDVDEQMIDKWYAENKSFVLTLGHYGNYEWMAQTLGRQFPHIGTGPYHKLSNPYFDNLFLKIRSRFGTRMYLTKDTYRRIAAGFDRPFNIALGNDQSAPPLKSYWTTFLNQDTSFFFGTEMIAVKYDMPVIFVYISRIKRGFYKVTFKLITDTPKEEEKYSILEKHANLLEEQIRKEPEFWLWSHRRWKHKKP